MIKKILSALTLIIASVIAADACTSALVPGKLTDSGRPMLWKHRDTGAPGNFLERVEPTDSTYAYIGLFNDGDSLLREAWMGMNETGFAIMNTASYNLPANCMLADQEGVVMTEALKKCATLADFAQLLDSWPKPTGVRANFGVMDAQGGMAYFEADDNGYVRYDAADSLLVRTNHSMSVSKKGGMGFERYADVYHILEDDIKDGVFTPISFTEKASRSFWNSMDKTDYAESTERVPDKGQMIPRFISTASIVIEGVGPEGESSEPRMWAVLGFPPTGIVRYVTLDELPDEVRPECPGFTCMDCNMANEKKEACKIKSKYSEYFNMPLLIKLVKEAANESAITYSRYR